MAKETFYFSHDYNARNDSKILELRAEYGAEGYGIYWMLIEAMAENNAIIDLSLIAGISINIGLTKEKLNDIILFCIRVKLFTKKGNIIFSKRLNEHKAFRDERSITGKAGAEKKWKTVREKKEQFKEMALFFNNTCVRCEGVSGLLNVERDHIIPSYQGGIDEITNYQPLCAKCNASKGSETTDHRISYCQKHGLVMPNEWLSHSSPNAKERKGKENKIKDIKGNEKNDTLSFEKFWDLYGKKVESKKCNEKWERLTDEQKTKIFETLPAYVANTPDVQFRKNPSTYLNNHCWDDELPPSPYDCKGNKIDRLKHPNFPSGYEYSIPNIYNFEHKQFDKMQKA